MVTEKTSVSQKCIGSQVVGEDWSSVTKSVWNDNTVTYSVYSDKIVYIMASDDHIMPRIDILPDGTRVTLIIL